LKGTEKVKPTRRIIEQCNFISPFSAFGVIFVQVANTVSLSFGKHLLGSAYARVITWGIFSSLVGVPLSAGLEAVQAEAKKCVFQFFQVSFFSFLFSLSLFHI